MGGGKAAKSLSRVATQLLGSPLHFAFARKSTRALCALDEHMPLLTLPYVTGPINMCKGPALHGTLLLQGSSPLARAGQETH